MGRFARLAWSGTIAALALTLACSGGNTRRPAPPPELPAQPPVASRPRAIETPALYASPLPDDPTRTTIHRLSNGMTVYLSPDPQQPTVVAHIAVRAGGRHDPKQSTGLAHYLEHMLFKGTSQLGTLELAREKPHLDKIAALYAELRAPGADRGRILAAIDAETQLAAAYAVPNELDQLYARLGITGLNAYTSADATVYTAEVPKNRLAQWARVEAQRFADPVFRLFWPELEAVYEEKNLALDDPDERVYEATVKALFPEHGYGWGGSVIGEVEHLKSPAYQDMEAFFARYYTPGNMAILLAGDVDASILPLLEKELGTLERSAGDAVEPGALPRLARRTELEVPVPADEGVRLVWQLPAATHADALALELLDLLLHDGESGIVERDLLIPQKVAAAHSSATLLREAGTFELAADTLDGQSHADAERLLLALVDKLHRGDYTDADIATAILTYDVHTQQQLESNEGRAALLDNAFVLGLDWRDVVTKRARLRQLTRADLVRVAKQYLTPEHLVVRKVKRAVTPPQITKPAITPVKLDPSRQTVFAKSILAMPVTPIEPVALVEGTDYKRGTLPTGEVITVENRRNELFSLAYEYEHGRADDRLACLAVGILQVSGAGKRTADELARQLHELGLALDTSCDKHTTRLTLSGLDRNLEAGVALLRDWLADPVISADTLEAKVATLRTERANAITSPPVIQAAQLQLARHGAESEFLVVPTNRQLDAARPAQLVRQLGQLLRMTRRTSYFGPRPHERAVAAIALGDGKLATRPHRPVRLRDVRRPVVFATHQDTAQTHVALVWPRKPTTDAERALGTLFSEYAALLLYQEVREARGLAYTVYGGYEASPRKVDDASVLAYAGVQGDKTHDALDAILATLAAPVDERRLDTAKQAVAEHHRVARVAPRAIAATVYEWQDEGERADPRARRVQQVLALDVPALEKWTRELLARPVILSLTGDRHRLDAARLDKLGAVTWVPVEKLFGF